MKRCLAMENAIDQKKMDTVYSRRFKDYECVQISGVSVGKR